MVPPAVVWGYNIGGGPGAGGTRGRAAALRRDGRGDYGGGLENRYAGDCIVGSNPTPSATYMRPLSIGRETAGSGSSGPAGQANPTGLAGGD